MEFKKIFKKISPDKVIIEEKEINNNVSLNDYPNTFIKKFSLLPEDFTEFTYSKKQHLEFFLKKKYDLLLFEKKKSIDTCGLEEYRVLLIYSFIINNIKPGSRILKIGKKGREILEALSFDYECWEIDDSRQISQDPFSENYSINITRFDNQKNNRTQFYEYFDFVFSISAFESIPNDITVYSNVVCNINKIKKFGAYSIHCFNLVVLKKFNLLNLLLFYLFNKTDSVFEKINYYLEQNLIPGKPDIFYIEKPLSEVENSFDIHNQTQIVKAISYNILLRKCLPRISKVTKTTQSDFRIKKPAYIFHHLMKCGGTSLAVALEKWFAMEDEFMYDVKNNSNNFELNSFIKHKLNLDNISSDTCIRGHYHDDGFFIHQRYPEAITRNKEFKIFTFIRDPLSVRISLYFYLNKEGVYYNNVSLVNSVINFKNILSYWLPCDESNYKEILDRYFFIGIVEKMQESFDKLADITGKKRITVPTFNTTKKDAQISELTPEIIDKFKKKNHLDYLIYNYCLEKFSKM